MRLLKINNSNLFAEVDDEDYDRLSKFNWNNANIKRPCIRRTRSEKASRILYRGGRQTINIPLANEIMQNFLAKFDHKDRNPFNFRKENLRVCTNSQNAANRNKPKYCSSQYKGVSWYEPTKKWLAQLMFKGKNNNLGYYLIETEAAKAYDKKALEVFGEFACINFP